MCQRVGPQCAKLLVSIPALSQTQTPTTKNCSKTPLPTTGLLWSTFGDSKSSLLTLQPISCSTLHQSTPPAPWSSPSLWPSNWVFLQESYAFWRWASSRVHSVSHRTSRRSHLLLIHVLAPRLFESVRPALLQIDELHALCENMHLEPRLTHLQATLHKRGRRFPCCFAVFATLLFQDALHVAIGAFRKVSVSRRPHRTVSSPSERGKLLSVVPCQGNRRIRCSLFFLLPHESREALAKR